MKGVSVVAVLPVLYGTFLLSGDATPPIYLVGVPLLLHPATWLITLYYFVVVPTAPPVVAATCTVAIAVHLLVLTRISPPS